MNLRLTIGKQITLLAGVLILSLISISVISYVSLDKLEKQTVFLNENVIEKLRIVSKMRLSVIQVQQWLTDISATRARPGYDDGFKEAKKWADKFRINSKKLIVLFPKNSKAYKRQVNMDLAFEEYYKVGEKMARAYIDEGTEKGNLIMSEFDPFAERLGLILSTQRKVVEDPIKTRFESIYRHSDNIKSIISIVSILSILFSLCLAYLLISKITNKLKMISNNLSKSSSLVDNTASKVDYSSTSLSEATNEQAAALQETVASIDEISAMVRRNSDSAKNSMKLSEKGQKTLHLGQEAVDNMIQSVNEINRSNEEIVNYMERSNQEISNIATVIGEIGDKTKVINDIVFQTKLLSFNASVEAARAGEHGKGFAVVAEEVGNLAQMSGDSAKEISSLLDTSIERVETTVEKTTEQLERLMKIGKAKIEDGVKKAQYCGEVIQDILIQSSEVNHMVKEISIASNEQAQGIQQVTIAMSQLDQVTQQNMNIAKQASLISLDMSKQSKSLNNIVHDLSSIVNNKNIEVEQASVTADLESFSSTTNFNEKAYGSIEKNCQNLKNDSTEQKITHKTNLKIVSGGNSSIPSSDDPRFEDI